MLSLSCTKDRLFVGVCLIKKLLPVVIAMADPFSRHALKAPLTGGNSLDESRGFESKKSQVPHLIQPHLAQPCTNPIISLNFGFLIYKMF